MFVDIRHASALAEAAVRTHLTIHEEAFCLLGLAQRDSTYVILAVVKPPQRTEIRRIGPYLVSSVFSAACPTGTIASLHTHPRGDPRPSRIDDANWAQQRRFSLHLIAFVRNNDPRTVGMTAHDYTDPKHPRQLTGSWLRAH